MILAAPIPYPLRPDRQLLRLGYELTAPVISKMRDFGVRRVHVAIPGMEDLDRHLAPLLSPAHQQCLDRIKGTVQSVETRTCPSIDFD